MDLTSSYISGGPHEQQGHEAAQGGKEVPNTRASMTEELDKIIKASDEEPETSTSTWDSEALLLTDLIFMA